MGVLWRDLDQHLVVLALLLHQDQRLHVLSAFSRRHSVSQGQQEHSRFRTNRILFQDLRIVLRLKGPQYEQKYRYRVLVDVHVRFDQRSINGITWSFFLRLDDSSVVCPLTRQAHQTLKETWIRAYSTICSGIDYLEMFFTLLFHDRIVVVIAPSLVPLSQTSSYIILIRSVKISFFSSSRSRDCNSPSMHFVWLKGDNNLQMRINLHISSSSWDQGKGRGRSKERGGNLVRVKG